MEDSRRIPENAPKNRIFRGRRFPLFCRFRVVSRIRGVFFLISLVLPPPIQEWNTKRIVRYDDRVTILTERGFE